MNQALWKICVSADTRQRWSSSFNKASLRVHFQVARWKSHMSTALDPRELGWKLTKGCFEPIMTDRKVAPDNILNFMRYRCKASTKNQCKTNICSCQKNGLNCVSACGECHGEQCINIEKLSPESSSDDEV